MPPTQSEFEDLLRNLRAAQTESPTVEGKLDLPLGTEGDRAFFIRHVAALANNVEPSYLIIGVENGTWKPIGLTVDSPLRNADSTQQRMNQALRNRLDPPLSIRYTTFEADGVIYGLTCVEGTRAPYVVAIDDSAYGGNRTKGEPHHIHRGVIYVRDGADSVAANRQSEILGIAEKARQIVQEQAQPDPFLETWNYVDVGSPAFGRHDLSERLVELPPPIPTEPLGGQAPATARSWISFVFVPIGSQCTIDPPSLKQKLKPEQRIGRGLEWFQNIPECMHVMLRKARATPKQYSASLTAPTAVEDSSIIQFFRVCATGHIEFGATYPLFFENNGARLYLFVRLVGYFWQMTYLARAIYNDAGCRADIRVLANLVGTKDTVLAEYTEGWLPAFHPFRSPFEELVPATDPNIQVSRTVSLVDASPERIEQLVREVATDIGQYYGQDTPRCFERQTGAFPVQQYLRACGW